MDELAAKYNRFLIYKISAETNKELPDEAKEFLKKPMAEFVATVKVALKNGMNVISIEQFVSEKIGIKVNDIPPQYYGQLRRYLEYFVNIAEII